MYIWSIYTYKYVYILYIPPHLYHKCDQRVNERNKTLSFDDAAAYKSIASGNIKEVGLKNFK